MKQGGCVVNLSIVNDNGDVTAMRNAGLSYFMVLSFFSGIVGLVRPYFSISALSGATYPCRPMRASYMRSLKFFGLTVISCTSDRDRIEDKTKEIIV